MAHFKTFLLTLTVLVISGCGYAFQGSGSVLPADVKNVYVPLVENSSTEPGLSETLTEAIRDRFERFGVLTVVDAIDEADAVLRARIIRVKRDTRSVTSRTDTSLQFDTTLTLAGELRRVSGPILWRNQSLSVTKDFGTTSDVVVASSPDFASGSIDSGDLGALDTREISRGQEREALNVLADEVARQIYDQAVSPDF